ncbi:MULTISPECIES: M24 family metallopeptidase [Mycobacterium]|uniref:Peptidase n=1 Tax=Mycobacterium kiyosense TaxID=2871094 RepID=A0A9P3UZ66_9MYCO|nr:MULTISPECIES: Xaa-Pro peptidase family protein [Mycobacterium]BDE14806.1 peptidase [Mycobacterium sp. 20KCMC460]GLB84045.1 peptidase [Mycobacterium kiyosense]GLB89230.1 peptidase [Mycobacterium kiyosense]GLB96734.1 peptidase [Mycobacterium kiyosense]GLC01452.1 peptidase [Mycobacterium kiyosense]
MGDIKDWAAGATIGGVAIPDKPDLTRMRRERFARLQTEMATQGLDGLVLVTSSAVTYATGVAMPAMDGDRAALFRAVAIVVRGEAMVHLYSMVADAVPLGVHLHPPLFPDLDDGISEFASELSEHFKKGARVGIDHFSHPMIRGLQGVSWADASGVMGAVKLLKTVDEVACIRQAQLLNELAMEDALRALRVGVRQTDLSAVFLRRVFELGASAGGIDPIWQVMAPSQAAGPWTSHGDLAYPTVTTDRFLRYGDVVWVDAGIMWEGYASDYGRTWLVGRGPNAVERKQFRRWRTVVDACLDILAPGVTGAELTRKAVETNGGVRPWMTHFYLAHGVGVDSAEMPLIGTDLGDDFDAQLVMQPGTVLVLEPVIWDDGEGGYRAEDIVAVTDRGWVKLSGSNYDPFGSFS